MAGAVCGDSYEDFRRGNRLPSCAVVLSDPSFVIPKVVEPLYQLEVAVYRQSGIFAYTMERPEEDSEFHSFGKCHLGSPVSFGISGGGSSKGAPPSSASIRRRFQSAQAWCASIMDIAVSAFAVSTASATAVSTASAIRFSYSTLRLAASLLRFSLSLSSR